MVSLDMGIEIAGLKMRNPVMLAAGILGVTGSSLKRVAEASAGAVVTKAHSSHKEIRIAELEKPENARWLALLFDTEGAIGWRGRVVERNRINKEYRHVYHYRSPYIGVGMDELESKETIDEGAKILGVTAYTRTDPRTGKPARHTSARDKRAVIAMSHMKPHLIKWRRMANLCLTLFKYHTTIPTERFDKVIEMLFGRYLSAKRANPILLRMTEEEFKNFLKRTEEQADLWLRKK